MTRRRRGKRGRTSPAPPAKRLRGGPPEEPISASVPAPAASKPALVMVAGLPPGCGVMALKSRLEAYGPIARARIDAAAATGYVTFRSAAAAVAAIDASLDPDGGIAIGSKKVLVVQASEEPNRSKNVLGAADSAGHHPTTKNEVGNAAILSSKAAPEVTYKAREMVAYDDLF
ncbi:hypothetical protein EJB05_16760 [Eragrostis curvula]|uniref:RRM domain-containing protein n=1 Tax=Eragrostis curvula TaxID=38414 RepID=A0A5J9VHN6_9POAL|nr:hypothetical protein EJB05_16760 [Eragrostis curvula]